MRGILIVLATLVLCKGAAAQVSGSVTGWGDPMAPGNGAPNVNFKYVAGGHLFSLGVTSQGGYIRGWGANAEGCAICTNCNPNSCGETACIPPHGGYVAVAAGWDHGLALHSNGRLAAWTCSVFNSQFGFFGTVITDPYFGGQNPVYTAIAAGEWFSMALRNDGTIWAWGDDAHGVISGMPIHGPGTFTAIAAGGHHAIALRSDGTISAWGGTNYPSNYCSTSPPPGVVPLSLATQHFLAVAAGHNVSYGILADGNRTLVGWGCQCAAVGTYVGTPSDGYFIYGTNISQVSGGYRHGLALTVSGQLMAWGQCNTTNCVCTGTYAPVTVPVQYQTLNVLQLGANNVGKHNVLIYSAAYD